MKILVIFGSLSDASVYEPLQEALGQQHETQFFALSAHRNASGLRECLERESYDAVVAGAGLAAHLPGVVASLTTRPVIGIPVRAQLGGMDSLLSILQMPAGVPVHTFASQQFDVLSAMLKELVGHHEQSQVQVVSEESEQWEWLAPKLDRVNSYCQALGMTLTRESTPIAGRRQITLCDLSQPQECLPCQKLCVPVLPVEQVRERQTTMQLAKLFATPSLFVGLNNLVNGFIATLQWMDIPRKQSIINQLKQGKLS